MFGRADQALGASLNPMKGSGLFADVVRLFALIYTSKIITDTRISNIVTGGGFFVKTFVIGLYLWSFGSNSILRSLVVVAVFLLVTQYTDWLSGVFSGAIPPAAAVADVGHAQGRPTATDSLRMQADVAEAQAARMHGLFQQLEGMDMTGMGMTVGVGGMGGVPAQGSGFDMSLSGPMAGGGEHRRKAKMQNLNNAGGGFSIY